MGEMRMELANVEECERYKSAENNFVVVWSKRGKKRAVGRALTPTYRPLKYPGQRFVDRNEFYPIGKWTFFYASGERKAEISYVFGCRRHCCSHGPCAGQYSFTRGTFTYWWSNGQLMATGEYEPKKVHVNNSCSGGTFEYESRLPTKTSFRSSGGAPTAPSLMADIVEDIDLLEPYTLEDTFVEVFSSTTATIPSR